MTRTTLYDDACVIFGYDIDPFDHASAIYYDCDTDTTGEAWQLAASIIACEAAARECIGDHGRHLIMTCVEIIYEDHAETNVDLTRAACGCAILDFFGLDSGLKLMEKCERSWYEIGGRQMTEWEAMRAADIAAEKIMSDPRGALALKKSGELFTRAAYLATYEETVNY